MLQKKIYLASQSPRRSELLKRANIPFEQIKVDVEEIVPPGMPVTQVAEYLANIKADAALPLLNDGILLTADTVVIQDDILLGKPVDRADAFRVLELLSGKTHEVITGVCLASKEKRTSFICSSMVKMAVLSPDEIKYYVDTFRPFDKAGAYAIQEWIGLCRIEGISGSYTNIMGLPTHMVYEALKDF